MRKVQVLLPANDRYSAGGRFHLIRGRSNNSWTSSSLFPLVSGRHTMIKMSPNVVIPINSQYVPENQVSQLIIIINNNGDHLYSLNLIRKNIT